MADYKISIITSTLNSERFLQETISSVAHQSYGNIEYIVIDGGSTDSTLEIIRNNPDVIDSWVSEPDKGIADAMNKGIKKATGEYILFLHSDDYLPEPQIIEQAASYLDGQTDLYFFDVLLESREKRAATPSLALGWLTNFKIGSCHQGQICAKKLFERIGLFDLNYKITMDYDFILRAYRAGATSRAVHMVLSVMRLSGISSRRDWPSERKRFAEERRAHFNNCPGSFMRMVYLAYWILYLPYRRIRSFYITE